MAVVQRTWSQLLGRPDLGADLDFFDAGGDSLLITRLARRITEQVGVRVPLRALLSEPTINGHAAAVEALLAQRDDGAAGLPDDQPRS